MSLFSIKTSGVQAGVQPWAQTLTLFPGSGNMDALFNLYQSLGDVTLIGANTITTALDGPEKVVRYGNLVLGDGTTATSLTAANRNKGLCILCETLTVKNNATLNMTGRGARVLVADDPFFPFSDFKIPTQVALSSSLVSLRQALAVIMSNGFAPWDAGTWAARVSPLFGFNLSVSQDGTVVLLSASGCGIGGNGIANSQTYDFGNVGAAGTNGGMGGGGSGGVYEGGIITFTPRAGYGCPYSGGSGTCGAKNPSNANAAIAALMSKYSGQGGSPIWAWQLTSTYMDVTSPVTGSYGAGGAGNPGGFPGANSGNAGSSGTGGKLVVIARTSITVQSGGKIEANGMPGGNDAAYGGGGGGSGGGHVSIITPSLTNSGTIQAAGGTGGTGVGGNGGNGGAGSVVTKTPSQMGW